MKNNMTKLYNTSFREQEGKYFIDYYTEPMPPEKEDDDYDRIDYEIEKRWINSKQSIEVHESQVEWFSRLSFDLWVNGGSRGFYTNSLQQGIEIPDDMVEIRHCSPNYGCMNGNIFDCNNTGCKLGNNEYAFLKQETKSLDEKITDLQKRVELMPDRESVKEQSQNELFAEIIKVVGKNLNMTNTSQMYAMLDELKSKFTITKK